MSLTATVNLIKIRSIRVPDRHDLNTVEGVRGPFTHDSIHDSINPGLG